MQNGTMLDERYRLEKKLGMALLVVHTGTGSRMVIKPRACFQDPRAIRHLSQLRHPALPRIIDEISVSLPDSEERCLVSEYLEGETFSEWMKSSGGRLLPDQLLPMMAETARTIAFLHDQNEPRLLHLDLKPEHLIRMPNGHAGLIDFDCSRLYPLDPITKSSIRCTIGYAAPELMIGTPGPESDIYALGVTMLVLLTGQSITDGVLPALEPLCRNLPQAVTKILATCMNTDPRMRYASAAALACALESLSLQKKFKSEAGSGFALGSESKTAFEPEASPVLSKPALDLPDDSADCLQQLPMKGMRRFPDQLVVIWDSASFAVILADHLARSGSQTTVIDADLMNPRVDLLLNLDATRRPSNLDESAGQSDSGAEEGLELALTALMRNTISPEKFPQLLQKTKSLRLMALTGHYRIRDYDFYDPQSLLALFRMSRMHADVVLVCCNRFIHDSFTCLSLLAADLVLIPLSAEPGPIREFNRYLDFLVNQYPFDRRKVRFIATDYDPTRHLSWGMIDELCGGLLAGCVSRRKSSANRKKRQILPLFKRRRGVADEYDQLLRRLGFVTLQTPDNNQTRRTTNAADHIPCTIS